MARRISARYEARRRAEQDKLFAEYMNPKPMTDEEKAEQEERAERAFFSAADEAATAAYYVTRRR